MTRAQIKHHKIKYDQRHDVLHVYLHPSILSVDEEEYPGVVIRRSVKDEQITGFMIMDYQKKDPVLLENLLPNFDFSDVIH